MLAELVQSFDYRFIFWQVTQLTGFSDPVYAEAYVHVNQYDIVLDVLVVNQTSDTLQNCTLELATLGEEIYHKGKIIYNKSLWQLSREMHKF